MSVIRFEVHGEPQSKLRGRAINIGGHPSIMKNPKTRKAEESLLAQIVHYKPNEPWTGPVRMSISFRLSRPKSHYGTGRNADRLKDSAPRVPTKKPDLDNLAKLVMDAMNGVFYQDDSQIVALILYKEYNKPKTVIQLEEL